MRLKRRFGQRYFPFVLAGLLAAGLFGAAAEGSGAQKAGAGQVVFERMLLLLQPTARQQSDLDALLAAQVTPGDARYHRWLTPAEFEARFGNSAADVAQVAFWLRSEGFAVAELPAGRGWIEFSGSGAQVRRAFGTAVAMGAGRARISGEIRLPATIAPLVKGLVSLDGSLSEAAVTAPVALTGEVKTLAAETSLAGAAALTPGLMAKILKLDGLQSESEGRLDGEGQSIAIPVRSNVRLEDLAAFRQGFGLAGSGGSEVNLAGAGAYLPVPRTVEEPGALLAASWAAAVAPGARIVVVPAESTNATDGLDLALAATIDGALARTVSVGFSNCEGGMSEAHKAFYAALYRQAAVEGISVITATGDSGAAACHAAGDIAPVTTGFGVNGLASTPWNTAVGAAALTGSGVSGWGQSTAGDPAFAGGVRASGGGASAVYAAPEWQSARGLPAADPGTAADHHRYLPDVAMPSAVGGSALAFCYSGDSEGSGCRLMSAGGSAGAAAIFSGISALLAEKYGPEGNLAPNLYALSRSQLSAPARAGALSDITQGGARLACAAGSLDCGDLGEDAGLIGFRAGADYDLATGLGTVNATALVEGWATPQVTGTLKDTVVMTTIGGITYNPSALIELSAKVISESGGAVPTGTIQFYDDSNLQNTGSPVTIAADGTASYSEQGQFTIGGHNILAQYSGDSSYAPGQSQPVTINIQPSATSMTVTPSTVTPAGGASITVTGTVKATNPGADPPTGSITVNLDGLPQGTAKLSTTGTVTSAAVNVTVPSAGSHTVQGTYSGDFNYNEATSPSVTITVAKVGTTTSISATPSTLTNGVPETFTATVASATTATTPAITGTVSFYDGGATLLGTATISANTAILTGITLSASATHTITAVYSGDANWNGSTSSPLLLEPVLLPVSVTLSVSSSVLAPGQTAALTATVTPLTTPAASVEQNPTGIVIFYSGTAIIGEGTLVPSIGDSSVVSLAVPSLAAGQYVILAVYEGDLTYGSATSNSITLQVEDFTIASTTTNINMVQGTTAQVPFIVTSAGGLTGPIQVVCAEQNPPLAGAISCIFSPTIVYGTGQTTLTVITTAGNISRQDLRRDGRPGSPWPAAGGGVALAFVGLLLAPIGRRARVLRGPGKRSFIVLALLLVGLAGAGLGCSNSVTPNGGGGTPLGVHTLKITAAAYVNNVTVSHNTYLTVNVLP